jgi:hypothetical protein
MDGVYGLGRNLIIGYVHIFVMFFLFKRISYTPLFFFRLRAHNTGRTGLANKGGIVAELLFGAPQWSKSSTIKKNPNCTTSAIRHTTQARRVASGIEAFG